jgi:hypothetical protein
MSQVERSQIGASVQLLKNGLEVAAQGNPVTDAELRTMALSALNLLAQFLADHNRIADALETAARWSGRS